MCAKRAWLGIGITLFASTLLSATFKPVTLFWTGEVSYGIDLQNLDCSVSIGCGPHSSITTRYWGPFFQETYIQF